MQWISHFWWLGFNIIITLAIQDQRQPEVSGPRFFQHSISAVTNEEIIQFQPVYVSVPKPSG